MSLPALLLAAALPAPVAGPATPPNIVLIVADDVGVDYVAAYGEGSAPPCTPHMDQLIQQGMLFRNAWTNTVCSPSRASIMTGRYSFRHGIGLTLKTTEPGLAYSELTLPEMLAGYESAALGKWHLHGNMGPLHPNLSGFDLFAGSLDGAVPDYFLWTKTTNGVQTVSTNYAVSENVDDAITAMTTMQEPWFLYVSFNAIHAPFHEPPSWLCPTSGCHQSYCANPPETPGETLQAKAMTEAMDTEIGRLLDALALEDPSAYVFLIGDNGTSPAVVEPPFLPGHAKGTMYEGGLNVPLVAKGPGIPAATECGGLVSSTDLFATFAELAGIPAAADDSVSMVPYFANPGASLRTTVYSERFLPNHSSLPHDEYQQAIRGVRYKLIRESGSADKLFDLVLDPFETVDLFPPQTKEERTAYLYLAGELATLLGGAPQVYCTAGTSASGCSALLATSGTPSATAPSGFVLQASGAEGAKSGIFYFGTNGRQANPWGNGTSYQCVVPPVIRTGLITGSGTTGLCDGAYQQDLNALWCPTCPKPQKNPGPGTAVQAQLWYRDPLSTSNQTTGLSDAIEFLVGN